MSKRKNPSKGLRFDVFKRDNFTCQYCGAQPPGVVLVCDHIDPVVAGGLTTLDNLITACEPCNQGKGKKLLGDRAIRPDADLMYLAVQQELAELKRYQEAERKRDALLKQIASDMQNRWMDITGNNYPPAEKVFIQLLRRYSTDIVHEAVVVTATKEAAEFFMRLDDAVPYLWGVAKRISNRIEEG